MSHEHAESLLPEGFHAEFDAARTDRDRWRVVTRWFNVKPVGSNHDIRPGMLYYVLGDESRVIRSAGEQINVDPVPMTVAATGQAMNPVPRKTLFELGRKSQLFRMTLRPRRPPAVELTPTEDATGDADNAAPGNVRSADASDDEGPSKAYLDGMLDMGSFTQLFMLAQQSGIVPAADQIAHVRDCEFRMAQYQSAFDTVDRVYVAFKQAADTRVQRLRKEEIDYKSGVLKMSAKEWMKKKAKDTAQTNVIERTRRNFVRVLDGLRVMIVAEP